MRSKSNEPKRKGKLVKLPLKRPLLRKQLLLRKLKRLPFRKS